MIQRRGLIGVVAVSVAVGLLIGIADIGPDRTVIFAAGVTCLIPFLVGLKRHHRDLFEPSYLFALSFGVLFFLRPMLEWSSVHGAPTIGAQDPTPTYLAALLVATIGGASFFAGYYSPVGRALATGLPEAPASLDVGRIRGGALVITVVGLSLYVAFLMASGGLSSFATVMAGRNPDFESMISQPLGYLYSGLLFVFPAGVALLVADRWNSRTGLAGMVLVFVSAAPQFFSGSRSVTLPALIAVALLWYLRRGTRPRLLTVVVVAVFAFFVLVSVPGDFRNTENRRGSALDAVATSISDLDATGREFFLGLDTAMLPAFAIEMQYVPDVIPYQFGSTFVEAGLRPIPRAVWSGKPDAADTLLMRVLWPDLAAQRIGLAFSVFGEPYLNFGVLGVVVILSLFGVAWRGLWEYWRRQPSNPTAIGILAVSWPFLFVYMRGGIGVDYQRQVIALVPFIALAWYAARGREAAGVGVRGPNQLANLTSAGRTQ